VIISLGSRDEFDPLSAVAGQAAILVAIPVDTASRMVATLVAAAYSGPLTTHMADAAPACAAPIAAITAFLLPGVAITMLCVTIQRRLAERSLRPGEYRFDALTDSMP
jgi:hypothetical protein